MMMDFIYIAFALVAGIQTTYWVLLFSRIAIHKVTTFNKSVLSTSIVTCFKNEAENLQRLVPSLLVQQDVQEIILVNDFSTDNSEQIVQQYASNDITLVTPNFDRLGKKAAIFKGVNAATTNLLLFTDADCKPATNQWATTMALSATNHNAILGFAPMFKRKGFIATFARYETYLTAIQYLSYAIAKMPYMGVGRNMLVRKSTALPILEQLQYDELASGDDDLLIQQMPQPIGIELNPKTFVYSEPPRTLKQYIRQKSRHISTASSYKTLHKLLLVTFAGTHILTYTLGTMMAIFDLNYFLLILLLKWSVQSIVNYRLMKILDERDLFWWFPILDIATFAYYIVLTPYLAFKNSARWN